MGSRKNKSGYSGVARVPEAQPAVAASSAGPAFQSDRGATSSAFGASVADAVVRLGQTASTTGDQFAEVALRIQTEDNERAAKDMDVKYAQALSAIGSGDGTEANPGFYATRGQNSIDQYEKVKETQRKARQKITEGSTNAGVLSRFNASADSRDVSESTAMGRHVAAQREAANDATGQARLDVAISDASRKWTDDSAFNENLAIITGEVSSLVQRKGLSPEVAVQMKLQATTQAVAGAFHAALAAEDTGRAADILTARKGLVEGTELAKLRKELITETVKTVAQALTEEAIRMHPGDRAAQEAYIHEIGSGETESAAIADLAARTAAIRGDEAEVQRAQAQQRQEKAERLIEDGQNAVSAAKAAGGTAADMLAFIRNSPKYAGPVEKEALAQLNSELNEGGSSDSEELSRAAQELSDEAFTVYPLDEEKRLSYIRSEGKGRGRDKALALAKARDQERRTRKSEAQSDEDRAIALDAQTVVADAIKAAGTPGEIRATILATSEGERQKAALAIFATQQGAERGDEGAERTDTLFEQGQEDRLIQDNAHNLVEASFGIWPNSLIGRRQFIRDNAPSEPERKAALLILENQVQAERGDEAFLRSTAAEARAGANFLDAINQRQLRDLTLDATNTARDLIEGGSSVASIPSSVRRFLTTSQLSSLETRSHQVASGEPVISNYEAYDAWMAMPPQQAALIDLAFARTQLGDQEFRDVQLHHTSALKPQSGTRSSTTVQMINAELDILGLDKNTGEEGMTKGWIRSLIMEDLRVAEDANGANVTLSDAEVDKIIHGITDKIVLKKAGWFRTNARSVAAAAQEDVTPAFTAEIEKFYLDNGLGSPTRAQVARQYILESEEAPVPAADAAAIRQAYQSLGKPPPTAAQIKREYALYNGGL